jgi:hypothetical protein
MRHSLHRFGRRMASARTVIVRYAAAAVSIVALVLLGVALFSPIFTVQEIRVARSDARVDIEQVQQSLLPVFGEHMFFLARKPIEDLIDSAIPDLQEATIEKVYPSRLNIGLTLQPIVARLRIIEPDAEPEPDAERETETGTGDTAVDTGVGDFLTNEGVYVRYSESQVVGALSGTSVINIVDWGVKPVPFMELVDTDMLKRMREAENALETEFGHTISERSVFIRSREFHMDTEAYELWFDMRSDIKDQLERYRIFLRTAGPGSAEQYVDLRLNDKVVYR